MKRSFAGVRLGFAVLALVGGMASRLCAQSTIDATLNEGWGGNIGWTNWLPSTASGVVVGEFVCQGYVYSANCGWINLGNGSPANGIQYQNNTATDWGVNYVTTASPGVANLRGYAYGANIGWINFEAMGNPSVNLLNGQLYGYAYSANCGWINLGNLTTYVVKTDSIAPGVDTDGDGIADAYELLHFHNLTTANATSDSDGDGISDLREYLDGTDATTINDALRITAVSKTISGGSIALTLSFNTNASRVYRIEQSDSLSSPVWSDAGLGVFLPDGATTVRQVPSISNAVKFYRVKALRLGI